MIQDLTTRLASLKQKETPTPLWLFLYIYSRTETDCYIDHMQGAKCLHSFLTEDGRIPLNLEADKYIEINNPNFIVPALLSGGYAASELAKIITPREQFHGMSSWLKALSRADRAIYLTMNQTVLPLLY